MLVLGDILMPDAPGADVGVDVGIMYHHSGLYLSNNEVAPGGVLRNAH